MRVPALRGQFWALPFSVSTSAKAKDRESERERKTESAKFNDTIHSPGDTRDQSLSPVTPKQTFLCDVKPWSSLEPNAIRHCSILKCIMTLRCIIGLVSFNTVP